MVKSYIIGSQKIMIYMGKFIRTNQNKNKRSLIRLIVSIVFTSLSILVRL